MQPSEILINVHNYIHSTRVKRLGHVIIRQKCYICTSKMYVKKIVNQKSLFGVSYPPPSQLFFGHLTIETKFSSEPDLSNPIKINNEDQSRMFETRLFSILEKNIGGRKRFESYDDTDLFFDFDIVLVASSR